MQKVIYHPEAELELIHGSKYYEKQCEGLGLKYILDIDESVQDIISCPQIEGEIRRHQLKHFPYGIFYRILPENIRILAISHLHREPGYWKGRK